jgi:putative ABC transport system permease protein
VYFSTIAAKNLLRRKMRTLFTVLGIGAAVGAFVALVGLSRGLENAWSYALLERETHAFAVPRGVVDILSASIKQDMGREMAQIEGVDRVSGELIDLVDLDTGEIIIVAGWPLDSYLWGNVELEAGRLPGPETPHGVILGAEVAKTLGYRLGDTFDIRTMTFTLMGISKAGGVMRNQAMLVSLQALQELNNRHGQVSTLNFKFETHTDRARVKGILAELNRQFPDYVFSEALDLTKNNRILALFRAMAWGTSIIALFIGLVVIINTLLMSVMERTSEFGLFSAVGWSERRIIGLIVIEALILSILGSTVGIAGGLAGLYAIADSPQMQGLIQPDVSLTLLIEVVLATIGLGLGGSIYPAWRATRLFPAQALRHE